MAAAMDVVKNDVPEPLQNLVSENEFAQKAMQLLQSAGGQAAMGQPPATPPTVKQRVDQQAMEGVAGLLSRLAPGMQQRGKQVQQAQARKMIGGGMPTMGASNMARMADGGIVGYQEGGFMGPPEANMLQRMGQGLKNYGANAQESMGILKEAKAGMGIPYGQRSAVMKQVRDEIEAQNQNRDPNFIERMGQKLMDTGLDVEESKAILKKFYNNMGKTYEEMSNGMAMGGEVKRFQAGMEVELDEDLIASLLAQQSETTGYTGPSAAERRTQLERKETVARANKANADAEYNLKARLASQYPELTREALDQYVQAQNAKRLDTVSNLEGLGSLRAKPFRIQGTDKNETPEFRMPDVNTPRPTDTEFMPEGSSVASGAGEPTTAEGLLGVLAQQTETAANVDTVDSPISQMLMARLNAAPDNEGALTQATTLREAETKLAKSAYEMSPELKAAYAAAKAKEDEYYKAQLDPKRLRSKKFDELLTGFAMPGGIARSGIAALKGTTGVDDAALEMQRQRGVEDFARTKEQAGIEREGRVKAYEGGRGTFNTAFDRLSGQATQALQTLGAMANSEQTKAQTERLANNKNQLDLTRARLDSIFQQGRLDEQSRATAVRLLDSQSRRLIDFRKQLSEILDTLGTPEEKAALLKENEGYIQSQVEVVNAARAALGMPAMPLAQTSTGGGSNVTPEQQAADAILGI
ncbi:hypothetical protein OAF51_01675 [Akkermansiaceae bacterium]|nr:hypothetical protein [Akkermansiaceae bacterium]